MFYDNFISLCEEAGVSPSRVLTNLSISKGSLSRWKNGGEPSNPNKKAIADYFGITVRQLMDGETEKAPTPESEGEDEELTEYLEELRTRPEMRMMFSLTKNATKEDIEKVVKIIEALKE